MMMNTSNTLTYYLSKKSQLLVTFGCFVNVLISVLLFTSRYPDKFPCNLTVIHDYIMWWMVYDLLLYLILLFSIVFYWGSLPKYLIQRMSLWTTCAYFFFILVGCLLLATLSHTCHQNVYRLWVFLWVHISYRVIVWILCIFYGIQNRFSN